ncbi:hypothetical protein GALMADRAFT_67778 [Galerina marginata CBS 339.88]|uniref:CxC6 like cysteine cluster associated with KDZ domain-containing protein n=1 Tax=Galerina marginata (strain CBS 339.88) TaxID=685588 RepID=A0A067SYM8_GALM3|nr:hypothetical protein GALMADRAFT_67778 [Galerina marginata CBS 339.88]
MYSFHASASAFAQYWNNTYGLEALVISCPHLWQAFVQDSLRTIAGVSEINLELDEPPSGKRLLPQVTAEAYALLGEKGIIRCADKHACSECTHEYKETSDVVSNDDPSKVVGVDDAPVLTENPTTNGPTKEDIELWTNQITIDGVVMGPQTLTFIWHCSFDNCINDLSNSRGGSLCDIHHNLLGSRCLVRDCLNPRIAETSACKTHQPEWRKYKHNHSS